MLTEKRATGEKRVKAEVKATTAVLWIVGDAAKASLEETCACTEEKGQGGKARKPEESGSCLPVDLFFRGMGEWGGSLALHQGLSAA